VAKRPNSLYVVNQRKEQDWQKIKGEYIHSLGDDLDVLIVGAFLSDGFKRGGKLSHFMCAVLDETSVQPVSCVSESRAHALKNRPMSSKIRLSSSPVLVSSPLTNLALA